MTAELKVLPGVNRPDLEQPTEIEKVLAAVLRANPLNIVVVGRETNGEIVVWSSQADADQVLGLLVRGTTWLARGRQYTRPDDLIEL